MSEEKKSKKLEEVAVAAVVAPVVVPPRRVSFEQWARGKKIPERHFRGMKAHLKDAARPRTESEWSAAFVGY